MRLTNKHNTNPVQETWTVWCSPPPDYQVSLHLSFLKLNSLRELFTLCANQMSLLIGKFDFNPICI